jgi:hypothetical protein
MLKRAGTKTELEEWIRRYADDMMNVATYKKRTPPREK